jgi:fructose-bisphosphate aldolase / 2-amino-3,7-dideoxy-D-threo-hept-6-ulosonate synthase
VAPIDDFLIFGPRNGLENRLVALGRLAGAGVDAVLTYPGAVKHAPQAFNNVGLVINLTASTTGSRHTDKRWAIPFEVALRYHANAVAAHVNMASRHIGRMLESAGAIVSTSERYEMPTVGIFYPRGEQSEEDENFEKLREDDPEAYAAKVAHAVAVGVDLGFDVIKTQFIGPASVFQPVIEAANPVPVLIAGGPLRNREQLLCDTREAFRAGAAGVSFGRNFFGRAEPRELIEDIRRTYLEERTEQHE